MQKRIAALLFVFCGLAAWGQNPSVVPVPTVPSSCSPIPLYVLTTNGYLYGDNGSGSCTVLATPGGSPGGPYLPTAGGTMTGNINFSGLPTAAYLGVNAGEFFGLVATQPAGAGQEFFSFYSTGVGAVLSVDAYSGAMTTVNGNVLDDGGGNATFTGTLKGASSLSLGTDGSLEGSVTFANSAANGHTEFVSAATGATIFQWPATVPANGDGMYCNTIGSQCNLTDTGYAYTAPLLKSGGTMTGPITGQDSGTWGSGGINGSIIGATTPEPIHATTINAGATITPILLTGSSSPNFNGTYVYTGQENGYNYYYSSVANAYIYSVSAGSYWLVSATLGGSGGTDFFVVQSGSTPPYTSSWSPQGGASGSVTSAAGSGSFTVDASGNAVATSVTSDNNYANANGTLLPSALTGYHGTGSGDVDVQISDGTGTSGNLSKYDANGGVTNGPTPPAGIIVGTTDAQTLSSKTLTSPVVNGGTADNLTIGSKTPAPIAATVIVDQSNLSLAQIGIYNPTALEPTSTLASGVMPQSTGGTGVASTFVAITSTFSFTATVFTSTTNSTPIIMPAIPPSTTRSAHCQITWEQLTAASTVQFGIGNSVAPTNEWVSTWMNNDSLTVLAFDYTTHTNTQPTAITAAETSAASATPYSLNIDFTVTNASVAPLQPSIWAISGSSSDAVQIQPGSYCAWL